MNITLSTKKLLLLALVSTSVFSSSLVSPALSSTALAASKPVVVALEGKAKQDYMFTKLDPVFHPNKYEKKAAPAPFTVPQGYTLQKGEVKGTKYEQLTPDKKYTANVLIQMHGGGYVMPLRDGHRRLGVLQSKLAGKAEVFYLDYKVAPQNHHPAALMDAVNLYTMLLDKGYKAENISFIGDSAGAGLVLSTALYLRDHNLPQPKSLVMVSPWGTLANTLPSRLYNRHKDKVLGANTSPLVTQTDYMVKPSYAGSADVTDPYVSPLYADNFKNLAPMLIQAGSYETLVDDSYLIAARAKEDGVKVQLSLYEAMPHDFALMLPDMLESQASFKEIGKFLK